MTIKNLIFRRGNKFDRKNYIVINICTRVLAIPAQ